jgi:hypothetical protein
MQEQRKEQETKQHNGLINNGETIKVTPVPADPIQALRGRGRGERLGETLLAARAEERDRDL